ncbi:MAG: manganese efflux pump MntP family protein [Oscillospiraceae bacterium]
MLSILLIGIALSMDAFAVSVTNGLTLKGVALKNALWMGVYFGGFQFLMPLIGYFLGSTVSEYISAYGPYISFFLLAFIGGKMLLESLKNDGGDGMTVFSHSRILIMAVATSLDALAVGVSFAFMEINLWLSCALIGGVTFVISFAGAMLGGLVPGISCKKAGILGGCVLLAIGVKLLLEGIF